MSILIQGKHYSSLVCIHFKITIPLYNARIQCCQLTPCALVAHFLNFTENFKFRVTSVLEHSVFYVRVTFDVFLYLFSRYLLINFYTTFNINKNNILVDDHKLNVQLNELHNEMGYVSNNVIRSYIALINVNYRSLRMNQRFMV